MSERLTFDEYGCLLALMSKSRSEDPHTKIGGIALDKNGRVLGASYNGLGSGQIMPNWMKLNENRIKKANFFIHCESNLCALLKKGECHTICLTQTPCIKCCQQIAALDIKRVVYLKKYRDCADSFDFMNFHNIEHVELNNDSKNKIIEHLKNKDNYWELF